MTFVRWTVRWGDVVVATGTGAIPPEYGLPQPRVVNGDRAVVRNGQLSAEAVRAPRPDRPFLWGLPDLQFAKVLVMCLMAFAAGLVLVRERIAELKVERPDDETDIFVPRLARWTGHHGFTRTSQHAPAIPSKDLERIRGFSRRLKEREAIARLYQRGPVFADVSELGDVFAVTLERATASNDVAALAGLSSELRGEAFGGLGLSGRRPGGGEGGGGIDLGSIGDIGHGGGLGGYGHGGLGAGLGSRRSRLHVGAAERLPLERVRPRMDYCLRGVSAGTVTTELELFEDGRVKTVTVDGADDDAKRCVMRTLEAVRFSSGERVVSARWTVD